MEILLLLYLSHYLGDYPLQSAWVYQKKIKSFSGGIYHACGIFLGLLVCLAPFLYSPWIWITMGFIVVTHYIQDAGKLIFNKAFEREILGYFGDQFLHLFFSTTYWFIFLRGRDISPIFGDSIYLNAFLIIYFIGLILVTYFWDITVFVIRLAQKKQTMPYQRNWNRLLHRGVLYSVLFFGGHALFL